ncbi:unnamed protein product [Ostreobium quekettii]|uniref:Uncharacterized protein n=1 Tax=Ostreobium quekettii TaxID=121088 RepID=A0A8S1J1N9_9CHLO|nr:unnamed protein product [Ostreobium quekettii]
MRSRLGSSPLVDSLCRQAGMQDGTELVASHNDGRAMWALQHLLIGGGCQSRCTSAMCIGGGHDPQMLQAAVAAFVPGQAQHSGLAAAHDFGCTGDSTGDTPHCRLHILSPSSNKEQPIVAKQRSLAL